MIKHCGNTIDSGSFKDGREYALVDFGMSRGACKTYRLLMSGREEKRFRKIEKAMSYISKNK